MMLAKHFKAGRNPAPPVGNIPTPPIPNAPEAPEDDLEARVQRIEEHLGLNQKAPEAGEIR